MFVNKETIHKTLNCVWFPNIYSFAKILNLKHFIIYLKSWRWQTINTQYEKLWQYELEVYIYTEGRQMH